MLSAAPPRRHRRGPRGPRRELLPPGRSIDHSCFGARVANSGRHDSGIRGGCLLRTGRSACHASATRARIPTGLLRWAK